MNRKEKQAVVDSLVERVSRARAVILTDFSGLKVEKITELRQQLRDKGNEYVVVKNRLMKRAVAGSESEALAETLVGPNGLGFSYDEPVELAKILVDFAKANQNLKVKGGILEGKALSAEQVSALANLPSREVLLAMVLGTMNAVPRNFVGVLAAVMRGLVQALKAIAEQKEAQAPAG